MHKVLFIKPFKVDTSDTEYVIGAFKERFPTSKSSLVANVFKEDYERLSNNPNIDRKFLYCPDIKKLDKIGLLKLLFRLRREKYDVACALISNPVHPSYQGYKNARLMAAFSGAERSIVHFTKSDISLLFSNITKECKIDLARVIVVKKLDIVKYFFSSILSTIFLFGIAAFFLIYVVGGIKFRRALNSLRNKIT